MLDSRVGRVAMVLAGFGLLVFGLAAAAINEANSRTVAWIAIGGLGLTVLCGLVVGLVWGLGGKGGEQ